MITAADQGSGLDGDAARDALDFIRNFADKCHHGKEEDHLFPALVDSGVPRDGGPIGVMLADHERGRELVQTMATHLEAAESDSREALDSFAAAGRAYIELLQSHIAKEDRILFSIANSSLDEDMQTEVMRGFRNTEEKHLGKHAHERYLALAKRLAERYGVSTEAIDRCRESDSMTCSH
jgi:hemerythrin-like domain-containing protein